jgi:hypothetical protein
MLRIIILICLRIRLLGLVIKGINLRMDLEIGRRGSGLMSRMRALLCG